MFMEAVAILSSQSCIRTENKVAVRVTSRDAFDQNFSINPEGESLCENCSNIISFILITSIVYYLKYQKLKEDITIKTRSMKV